MSNLYGIKNVYNENIKLDKEVIIHAEDLIEAIDKFDDIYHFKGTNHAVSIYKLNLYEIDHE